MTKYYRLILINTKTGEREMLYTRFTNKKKVVEFGENWKKTVANSDYEVKEM